MALRKYPLPNGIFYLNTGDMIEHFKDGGVWVTLHPQRAYLGGGLRGVPLEEYFAAPELWESRQEIYQAIKEKGKTVVALDASQVRKWGDQIMLTVISKAYRETWKGKATVDIVVSKEYEDAWENNPHVRNVINKLDETMEYDKVVDVTAFGLKFRREMGDARCIDMILNGMGLTLVSKTPVFVLTEKEKEWAKKRLEREKKEGLLTEKGLIGISLFSAVKSRTYPRMMEVAKRLRDKGYGLIFLDHRDENEPYPYTSYPYSFRQTAALINICDLIVTADSALLHLAGALEKRIVGLFGSTEGFVFTEAYEKSSFIQALCPYNKKPCWWDLDCLAKGGDYRSKMNKDFTLCLKNLKPEVVVAKAEEQFTKPKNLFLIMLTYNCLDMTRRAVESIRSYHNYNLFIVDNKSTDGTQKWLKEQNIDFISKRMNVAAAQNIGIERFKKGNYDYFIFFNNDIALRYDMLDKLVECAERSGAYGIMGTQRPQSWNIDSTYPDDNKWTEIVDIPAGSYSATLFTKECIEKVGIFDERFEPRYIEDNDYTIRIRGGGGKFVRAHGALFWHYLGAVVKTVEKTKATDRTKYWMDNVGIFQEKYGFHPHESQHLEKLGLEWKKDKVIRRLEEMMKGSNRKIRIQRKMGGYGDILFTSVIARELKQRYGDKIIVEYAVPEKFFCVLENNPNIDILVSCATRSDFNFCVDMTDLEFRVELQEMQKYGEIRSARTEIYLDILGLPKDNLKPDYFVTEEEKGQAEEIWSRIKKAGKKKRIVCVGVGSNKLKRWPLAQDLFTELRSKGYGVLRIDEDGKARWPFRGAAALVATADLVISPDSGISNLAGALDIPAITIFSNRNKNSFEKMFETMIGVQGDCPHKKENYCDFFCPCLGSGPHRAKENIKVPDCLKRLEVEEVYERAKEIIDG